MSWQEVISPGEVLDALERERLALFEDRYQLTTQKIVSVEKGLTLLGDDSNRKNFPKKRAKRFLHAAIDHSEELFLLGAFAAATRLISTFAKIETELGIRKVLSWWDCVDHPPKLKSFRKDFVNLPSHAQAPNKRPRILPSNPPETHGLANQEENTTRQSSQTDQTSVFTLSESLEECRSILNRLYPTHHTKSLLPLSRKELIALLSLSGPQESPSQAWPTEFGVSPGFQSPILPVPDDDPSINVGAFGDTPPNRDADLPYHVIPSDQPASGSSQKPGSRSKIQNLRSQDLFDFLTQSGCVTLEIRENEDDTTILPYINMLGSSDKPDVKMVLQRHIVSNLLEYMRILGKATEPRLTIKSHDLFHFLTQYKGGCNPLAIQLCWDEKMGLPSIAIAYGPSDEVDVEMILQRDMVVKLLAFVK